MAHIVEFFAEEDEEECGDKGGDNKNIEEGGELDVCHPAGKVAAEVEADPDAGKPDTSQKASVAVRAQVGDEGETDGS